jgi:3-oxoacid CoA-transferase
VKTSKVYESAAAAIADIQSGAMIAVGGFGPVRNRPSELIEAVARRPDVRDVTVVTNSFRYVDELAETGQLTRLIASFGGSAYGVRNVAADLITSGALEFEPCPQGILAERLRHGAAGLPAFFSPVGVDTVVAEGKERRRFGERNYILETALKPDYGFVRAQVADELGNLSGIGSTINFHPTIAAASRIAVAEVDEIVPVGAIRPEDVRVPSIYVDRLVLHDSSRDAEWLQREVQIGNRRPRNTEDKPGITIELMAMRVARLLKPGQFVNLGVGMPVLVGAFIGPESGVILHAENGFLGYGPPPHTDEEWYLYDAQGRTVTSLPGASFFSSVEAFTMARGGHLDAVVLGGFQVSRHGDLANWWAPHMAAGGMGGAMDLVTDVKELIVIMEHTTRDGAPKILNECSYALTVSRRVTKIVTDLALIEVTPGGLVLREVAPGVTPDYVQSRTEPPLIVAPDLREMEF